MTEWISLGLGLVSLGVFGNAIKKSIKESKQTEPLLHANVEYTKFLEHDGDLKYLLQRLEMWKMYNPEIFDGILYHCNALLGVQLWCESKHSGYRAYAGRAQRHNTSIIIGLDMLQKWICESSQSGTTAHFEECKKELTTKCGDYMHNIRLVVHA